MIYCDTSKTLMGSFVPTISFCFLFSVLLFIATCSASYYVRDADDVMLTTTAPPTCTSTCTTTTPARARPPCGSSPLRRWTVNPPPPAALAISSCSTTCLLKTQARTRRPSGGLRSKTITFFSKNLNYLLNTRVDHSKKRKISVIEFLPLL